MTEQHPDQLREAFAAHEHNTPDPSAVYARVVELSGRYKRRRRGAQIAAGGVLGAGLIAGAVNLPAFLPGGSGGGSAAGIPAAAAPAVSPSSAPSDAELQARWQAYADAGYGLGDAEKLAKLWHLSAANPGAVKAEAGRRLLLGETLPVKPHPDVVPEDTTTPEQQKQFQAFFDAGYVWEDAEKLAGLWNLSDPPAAKLEAGKRLLAGDTLPVQPKPANVTAAREQKQEIKRLDTFFARGYDGADAAELAELWHLKTPYEAKIEGGRRLLAGETLPIQP
ncbi:hypothetical protein Ade02nite_15990 [Paractinoplanes deccanensis]|uniref:Uncharacterized protein n=1 Tax=Paractinoplanes deccanensis TaxID=113561 RepID=A0ABQ3XYX7_9ACTN|nr:hypothetical protein [Actinoplanes deccanensis]GID72958.1 hypothetical protein Ade02nite_15990 [Actinoplanes deccanensis]